MMRIRYKYGWESLHQRSQPTGNTAAQVHRQCGTKAFVISQRRDGDGGRIWLRADRNAARVLRL